MPEMKETKVLLAMSGGVDSSAAGKLLRDAGYDCVGCTMKLYENEDAGLSRSRTCCSLEDVEDARSAAFRLGIPYYVFNFTDAFREKVIGKFTASYCQGLTPNPCIDCNRYLKFGALFQRAELLGCRYVATGHYARIDCRDGRYHLRKARDESKDQSYVLYMLSQDQLARTLFPLGEMEKPAIRDLAEQAGLVTARKRDSQDICFVPDGDYAAFIARCVGEPSPEGDFLDAEGRVLGRHKGFLRYTRGQHKGLGLVTEQPLYVQRKDPDTKAIYLGPDAALYSREATVRDCSWIAVEALTEPRRVTAKIRHSRQDCPATVEPLEGGRVRILFDEAQRACAPGQSAVFYEGDAVLGGGFLE